MFNILLSECSDYALAQYLHIIKKILDIIQIIGPIVTIVALGINLTMATINVSDQNNKKTNKKIINSLLATVILFFVPMIVNLVMHILADNGFSAIDIPACWVESENIYEILEEEKNLSSIEESSITSDNTPAILKTSSDRAVNAVLSTKKTIEDSVKISNGKNINLQIMK